MHTAAWLLVNSHSKLIFQNMSQVFRLYLHPSGPMLSSFGGMGLTCENDATLFAASFLCPVRSVIMAYMHKWLPVVLHARMHLEPHML